MAKKAKRIPHNKKITDEQAEEICRLFYDEEMRQVDIAERMGVSQTTVSETVNHPDRLAKMLKRTTAERVRAQIKINHHLLEAADTQIELMRGTYEDQYKYLKQNAARDILDRGGVRAEKDEGNEMQINVSIGGAMVLGTPDHSRDNDEDALSRDNEEEADAE